MNAIVIGDRNSPSDT